MTPTIPSFYLKAAAGSSTMCPLQQPLDFVVTHQFEILLESLEDTPKVEIAEIKLGQAMNKGVSWFDVMSEYCFETDVLYSVLFEDPGEHACEGEYPGYRTGIDTMLVGACHCSDILYIHSTELADSMLGLAVLETLLDHSLCGVAALRLEGLLNPESPDYALAMTRKSQLERIGFQQAEESCFMLADLGAIRPSLMTPTQPV